jgi:hypothetical protein
MFTVHFTLVEIACGLFDFAVSAQSIYPTMHDTSSLPWFYSVEHLLTPNHTYNVLGWVCWLANTGLRLGVCLRLKYAYALAPFALLYAWHECVQLAFVVVNWKETCAVQLKNQGIEVMRECKENERDLLKNVYEQTKATSIY